jgi:very-short-patch-repair endonuclease
MQEKARLKLLHKTKPILTDLARILRREQTETEKLLWARLRALDFEGNGFRRQQPIDHYIVDFVHFGKRLVIEVDGGQHNERKNITHDNQRTVYLEKQGFHVIRF